MAENQYYGTGPVSYTHLAFMQSVVTSATLLGAIFGALLTGPLSDRLGRRRTVIVISILFLSLIHI